MSATLSQQLCGVFGVVLPEDVVDWVDGDIRTECADSFSVQFSEPIEPSLLIDPDSSPVWGGQMLPDTLPFLGNGGGDVLCLRFAKNGTVKEVIRWNHEGGVWCPFGQSLCEAIICDIAITKAFEECDEGDATSMALAQWALSWCRNPAETRSILAEPVSDISEFLDRLLGVKIGETALRREKCQLALKSGLSNACHKLGWSTIADRAKLKSHDYPTWLFDASMIPEEHLPNLANTLGMNVDVMTQQNWSAAASEATTVVELSPSVGWPYLILGRHAERSGRADDASRFYLKSLERRKPSFDFLEMFGDQFALSRILALETTQESSLTEYLQVVVNSKLDISAIRKYWMSKGREAEKSEKHDIAYDSYYNAGWDAYSTNSMDEVLDGLARSAMNAGFPALGLIAKHHRRCVDMY